jgi:hypothetical protein
MVQVSPYRYWCLNSRSRSATLSPVARNSLLLHNYFLTTVEDGSWQRDRENDEEDQGTGGKDSAISISGSR